MRNLTGGELVSVYGGGATRCYTPPPPCKKGKGGKGGSSKGGRGGSSNGKCGKRGKGSS